MGNPTLNRGGGGVGGRGDDKRRPKHTKLNLNAPMSTIENHFLLPFQE